MNELRIFYRTTRIENLPDRYVRFSNAFYTMTSRDLPTPDSKEAYLFAGWFLDPEFETPCIVGDQFDSDVTLYGKWEATDEGKLVVGHKPKRFQFDKNDLYKDYPLEDDEETILKDNDEKLISDSDYQYTQVSLTDPDNGSLLNLCAKDIITETHYSMAELTEVTIQFENVVNVHDTPC